VSKFGKALDKEQYRAFKKAWILKCKIENEVMELADMNFSLAYGAIRVCESLIDGKMASKMLSKPPASKKELEAE
jgi:hypothetical protein